MKKIILFVIIFLFTLNLKAQLRTDLRFEVGGSIAFIDNVIKFESVISQPVLNYKIGINPSYSFLKFISLKSGVNIQKTGFRKFEIDTTSSLFENFVVNYYYLEVPILLYFKPLRKISFYGGGSLKYLFLSNYNSKTVGKYVGIDYAANKIIFDVLFGLDYNISDKIKIGLNFFGDIKRMQKKQYYSYKMYNLGTMLSLNYNLF